MLNTRLAPILEGQDMIPTVPFEFREKHAAVKQIQSHCKIMQNLEDKKYCPAVFLDVRQVFDKVRHIDLLYKILFYSLFSNPVLKIVTLL